jgi:hypothetical protein
MKRISSVPELEAKIDKAMNLMEQRHAKASELDDTAMAIYKAGDRAQFGWAN